MKGFVLYFKVRVYSLIQWVKNEFLFNFQIQRTQKRHLKCLEEIRTKEKINILFLVILESVWKYDSLYLKFHNDNRFQPTILICPRFMHFGNDETLANIDKAYKHFKDLNYNVSKSNLPNGKWLDAKSTFDPDIVYFTSPHPITHQNYSIQNFLDTLTCYVPYGIIAANLEQTQFNRDFHNLIWRCYYETNVHKKLAEEYSRNKGANVVVTGYPLQDQLFKIRGVDSAIWKNNSLKKIIWAPHHSIHGNDKTHGYSNFLEYSEEMLSLTEEFKQEVQFAFKPHPSLKPKLYKEQSWGRKRTDEYYALWDNIDNKQLECGDYIELFNNSDALILDSISFISEYLYTMKPSIFTVRNSTIEEKFNKFGKMAFDVLYKSYSFSDVRKFVQKVVLQEEDVKWAQRKDFVDNTLVVNDNKVVDNIFSNLTNSILK